jgi:hypothetical protein
MPAGEPIFSEQATEVYIEDEAAGPFVVVAQGEGKVSMDFEQWPAIRDAIETAFKACQEIGD